MQKLKTFFKVLTALLAVVFISSAGPEIHSTYIRSYVGSKTVMIKKGRSGGSGFFVETPSGKTYILTNRHVCDLSQDGYLTVISHSDHEIENKKIIKKYDDHDLCLVESIEGHTGLDLASFIYIGQTIGIMGNPKLQPLTFSRGEFIGNKTIKVLLGYNIPKEKCRGEVVNTNFINLFFGRFSACVGTYNAGQVTAYSRGGSSGSAVVNFFGNIVGVLFAGNRNDQFESFIVPLEDVQSFLRDY